MHLSVLPVHHMYASCLQNPEDGISYSRSGVISMSHGVCWKLNSSLRMPAFLASEPSLQPRDLLFWMSWDSTSSNLKTPEQTQSQVAAVITAEAPSFPHGGIPSIFYVVFQKNHPYGLMVPVDYV